MASNSYMIKFGADAASVTKAIAGVSSDMKTLNAQARAADKAFKLTGDTSALDGKLDALKGKIALTEKQAESFRKQLATLVQDNGGELPQTAKAQNLANKLKQTEATLTGFNAELKATENQKAGDDIASGFNKADSAISKADKSAQGIHGSISKAGVAMGSFVGSFAGNLVSSGVQMIGSAFSGMVGDVVEASDSINQFQSTMKFAGASSKDIDKLTASSQDYANKTVYDLKTVLNTTAQLGANGVKNYGQLVQAAGNLNAVVGGNADTFQSVSMVLTQTAGAGKLTTENWNQLADAIPGASGKLQDAMKKNGAYTGNFRDAMEKGQISSEEFNKAIMKLGFTDAAKKAATSTKTIQGAMGNLQASFVTVGTNILDSIKKPLTDAISWVADAVPKIAGAFSGLGKGIDFSGMFGGLKKILDAVIKSVSSIDLSGIIKNFQSIGKALSNMFSGLKLDGIQNIASQILPAIVAGFQNFMNVASPAITQVMGAFKNLWNALEPVRNMIADLLVPAFKILGNLFGGMLSGALSTVSDLFNGLAGVLNFLKPVINVVSKVLQAIAPILANVATFVGKAIGSFRTMSAVFSGVGKVLGSIGSAIGKAFSSMGSTLSRIFKGVRSAFSSVGSLFGSVGSKIGRVARSIIGFFTGIGGKIARGFGNVVGAIAGKFSGVRKGIMRAFGNLGNIGMNVVKGIAAGITNGTRYIKGVITRFVGHVVGFIKKIFKIHSPSRLMRDEVGTYITQGIAVGMVDRPAMNSINKSARGVTSATVGAFSSLTSPSSLNGAIVGGGTFASPAATGSSNTQNSLVFNVSGADPTRNAEAIRKVLRQEKLI